MLHLAWTLRGTRPPQSLTDLKTGWTPPRRRTCLRRMNPRRCPMTGAEQNPASVPGFLCLAGWPRHRSSRADSLPQGIFSVGEVNVGASLLAITPDASPQIPNQTSATRIATHRRSRFNANTLSNTTMPPTTIINVGRSPSANEAIAIAVGGTRYKVIVARLKST